MRRLGRVLCNVLHGLGWLYAVGLVALFGYLFYRLAMGIMPWTGPGPVVACAILAICLAALMLILVWRQRGKTEEELYDAHFRAWVGQLKEEGCPGSAYDLFPTPSPPPDQPKTPPPTREK